MFLTFVKFLNLILDPPKIQLNETLYSNRHEFKCSVSCANPNYIFKFTWTIILDNSTSHKESITINSTNQIEITESYNNLRVICCVSNFILDSVCETRYFNNKTFTGIFHS
jgi:hypothetical protein